jgi:hypothetical protein
VELDGKEKLICPFTTIYITHSLRYLEERRILEYCLACSDHKITKIPNVKEEPT